MFRGFPSNWEAVVIHDLHLSDDLCVLWKGEGEREREPAHYIGLKAITRDLMY